ncbi:pyruvate kinase [Dickeya dianthicola]|uniref:Pyruvate kinase n=1 Tax=Dickeya dianthicola TaxID=204039 RepID=A0AAW4LFV2_9GAMM|nr:pyruvate kinase [Dickeya dianthicola]ATO34230.1 Pyruvate kinase [Dickeya dianthicola RNS04.9]MBT1429139.1 pyruvate kinase [Dickeya dianthicola]MBT1433166.1 pyruvate kinase [Dickeya dianthicola]MBT1460654.1 pyruvate kinase [Dickeya dianthicola]MBT1489851.1 pyruvate kinase [Dickeya dianthicola]
MAKTRVIATIGPVSRDPEILKSLNAAGMSVARLNGSHNTLDWHKETIRLLRDTLPETPILLDIPGRKIRTLQLKHEPIFSKGNVLILTTDINYSGEQKVPVGYDKLHEKLKPGDRIFADDGTLSFSVVNVDGRDIHIRADMNGQLKSRKGINVPGIDLGQSLVTEKDKKMIDFAKDNGVDYIGISFVESKAHVEAICNLINNDTPKIVAKVENSGGIENLEEVISAADVIMIDRGDLAVETSINHVSLYQKKILKTASLAGKPTIVATEMLHSMIENPLPTKAEVSDITNAVLDGAAAVMLSGETAVGRYPVEAVSRISGISQLAEAHLSAPKVIERNDKQSDIRKTIQAITQALPLTRIIVLSRSGYSVRIASMSGSGIPVIAVGNDPETVRGWNIFPDVVGIALELTESDNPAQEVRIIHTLLERQLVSESDYVLIISVQADNTHRSGNVLRTLYIRSWLTDVAEGDLTKINEVA